jgi:hypothetical protein
MLKTKQDYIQCICREMEQFIPRDRHIRIEPASVVKTNDRSCSGLTFFDEEIGGGPTVWMEKPYDEYVGGAGIRTQAFELWYRTVLPQLLRTPLPEEMDTGLDRLSFKLLDGSRNRAYLADKPHVPAGNGFVYTFVSKHVHPNDPDYVFVITEAVLARAGLDAEDASCVSLVSLLDVSAESPVADVFLAVTCLDAFFEWYRLILSFPCNCYIQLRSIDDSAIFAWYRQVVSRLKTERNKSSVEFLL